MRPVRWQFAARCRGRERLQETQEQIHSGLNLPNRELSHGGHEAGRVGRELRDLALPASQPAPVALIFDYEAAWITRLQPHGADFRYIELAFRWYEAARRFGLDLDIVASGTPLSGYRAVLVPTLPYVSDAALAALREYDGPILFGLRSGSKTRSFQIPDALPPGPLQDLLPLRVTEVASLRPGLTAAVAGPQITGRAERWREWLTTELPALASFADGTPALVQAGSRYYLGCWPDEDLVAATLQHLLVRHAGLIATLLPAHVRLRRRGDLTFAFNYGPEPWQCPADADYLLGGPNLAPQDLACWRS
jgi:beta-galactosidase